MDRCPSCGNWTLLSNVLGTKLCRQCVIDNIQRWDKVLQRQVCQARYQCSCGYPSPEYEYDEDCYYCKTCAEGEYSEWHEALESFKTPAEYLMETVHGRRRS